MQWDQAVELAKTEDVTEVDSLLAKYASYLLEKKKRLEAVELYRKANHHIDAARLLYEVTFFYVHTVLAVTYMLSFVVGEGER